MCLVSVLFCSFLFPASLFISLFIAAKGVFFWNVACSVRSFGFRPPRELVDFFLLTDVHLNALICVPVSALHLAGARDSPFTHRRSCPPARPSSSRSAFVSCSSWPLVVNVRHSLVGRIIE